MVAAGTVFVVANDDGGRHWWPEFIVRAGSG
jgi:hypothetical protein